jgi:nucleoside-triphosphatase THEP1
MDTWDERLRYLQAKYDSLVVIHDMLLHRYITLLRASKNVVMAITHEEREKAIDDLRHVLIAVCKTHLEERGDGENA